MRKVEIDEWALRVIDAALKRAPTEWDERVELKSGWTDEPPPDVREFDREKAKYAFARMLGAHANAARGEPILWLFGVDEKGAALPGVGARDTAQWWPTIENFFDGPAPRPTFRTLQHGAATIAVLFAETEDAPYVVKNPQHGTKGVVIEREVPWRANASTRSARREDLIRMLVPRVVLPTFELDEIEAAEVEAENGAKRIYISGLGYLVHLGAGRLHIPDRLASGEIVSAAGGEMPIISAKVLPDMAPVEDPIGAGESAISRHVSINPHFVRTDDDCTVLGPGQLEIEALGQLEASADRFAKPDNNFDDFSLTASISVTLRFGILGSDAPIVIRARLRPDSRRAGVARQKPGGAFRPAEPDRRARWVWDNARSEGQ